MSLTETRIANARLALERAGGVGKAAKAMGYANSSFLVQMFGPSPIRTPTEKTMRRMEQALGLRPFTLDQASEPPAPPPAPGAAAAALRNDNGPFAGPFLLGVFRD